MDLTFNVARQDGTNLKQESCKAQIFHVVNPHPVAWNALFPTIVKTLNHSNARTKKVDTISFPAWLDRIRANAEEANGGDIEAMLKTNPAAKLMDFYEKLAEEGRIPDLDTSRTEEASLKMRALDEIKPEWVEHGVRGWLAIDEKRRPHVSN